MTIILDMMWALPEVAVTISVVGLPAILWLRVLSGGSCLIAVTTIQAFVDRNDAGEALAKGLAMAIAAGVPYPVVGTSVGGLLLAWAGVSKVVLL